MARKYGIAANLTAHPTGNRCVFDPRTRQEVDETRDLINRKPFRNKRHKRMGINITRWDDGSYRSLDPVQYHKVSPLKGKSFVSRD